MYDFVLVNFHTIVLAMLCLWIVFERTCVANKTVQ